MDQTGLRAVILGASGAVGRELVVELTNSPKWTEVAVIVRRKLDQWDTLPNKHKLKITQVDNLDILEKTDEWKKYANYNTFFCVLGSRVKEGDAQFTKVDLTYPIYGGHIARANAIPHYSLLTSIGADKGSMFLYTRIKGLVEEALTKQSFPYLTIHRAGAILNRVNDERIGETILKYIPFIDKIECKDLAKALRVDAEKAYVDLQNPNQKDFTVRLNTNKMLLDFSKQ
ncbi:unnamed protein product [Paramecium primaurelia]|uniref:NAD(P)-binding domain-containing protein n=1 Tax=Paramecium primaurelia TaxID=5886 RepID=A0A8S1KKT1_PARPR|nr:unnamed protein product [Paramecium primaurelia]